MRILGSRRKTFRGKGKKAYGSVLDDHDNMEFSAHADFDVHPHFELDTGTGTGTDANIQPQSQPVVVHSVHPDVNVDVQPFAFFAEDADIDIDTAFGGNSNSNINRKSYSHSSPLSFFRDAPLVKHSNDNMNSVGISAEKHQSRTAKTTSTSISESAVNSSNNLTIDTTLESSNFNLDTSSRHSYSFNSSSPRQTQTHTHTQTSILNPEPLGAFLEDFDDSIANTNANANVHYDGHHNGNGHVHGHGHASERTVGNNATGYETDTATDTDTVTTKTTATGTATATGNAKGSKKKFKFKFRRKSKKDKDSAKRNATKLHSNASTSANTGTRTGTKTHVNANNTSKNALHMNMMEEDNIPLATTPATTTMSNSTRSTESRSPNPIHTSSRFTSASASASATASSKYETHQLLNDNDSMEEMNVGLDLDHPDRDHDHEHDLYEYDGLQTQAQTHTRDDNETSFNGNHSHTWEVDVDANPDIENDEVGLQIQGISRSGSEDDVMNINMNMNMNMVGMDGDVYAHARPQTLTHEHMNMDMQATSISESGSGLDSDGFFTANFDFTTPNMNTGMADNDNNGHGNDNGNNALNMLESFTVDPNADSSGFQSFDAAEDWNPSSGDFSSFGNSSSNLDDNNEDNGSRDGNGNSNSIGINNGNGNDGYNHMYGRHMESKLGGIREESRNAIGIPHSSNPDVITQPLNDDSVNLPAIYSAPSPSRSHGDDNSDDNDQRHLIKQSDGVEEPHGPIDSDTLEAWNPNEQNLHVFTATRTHPANGNHNHARAPVPQNTNADTLRNWLSNTNTMEFQSSHNQPMPVDEERITTPIDIDTGEPWAPTGGMLWTNPPATMKHVNNNYEPDLSLDDNTEIQKENPYHQDPDEMDDESFDEEDFAETHEIPIPVTPSASASAFVTPPAPTKMKVEREGLTLGVLAQISGLVDFTETNSDKYGNTYEYDGKDDDSLEHEEAMSKASRKVLEVDETSSPAEGCDHSMSVVSFHEDGKTLKVLNAELLDEIISPFEADLSEIEKTNTSTVIQEDGLHEGIEKDSTPPDVKSELICEDSPFHSNVSNIHNQSHHHIDQTPTNDLEMGNKLDRSGNIAAPRALEEVFRTVDSDDMDTVQAEHEMERILKQVKAPPAPSKVEHSEAPSEPIQNIETSNISYIKEFWKQKQKQHKVTTLKTDPVSVRAERQVNVDWPDAPASTPLKAKEQSVVDELPSRNKRTTTKKDWDVPTSVTTTMEGSFATEMSSMCEGSYDLTEDGFQVPKRKSAKEVYRANKVQSSADSAKGFFWRSHPEGPGGISRVEVKARKRSSSAKQRVKKNRTNETNPSKSEVEGDKENSEPSEYINFPKTILSRASRDEEEAPPISKIPIVKYSDRLKPNTLDRVKSMPKKDTSNSFAWDKHNLKLRKIDLSRSKSVGAPQGKATVGSSPTMEWKKAIEAKIKSTSEKVKAAANNATSGPATQSDGDKKPPPNPKSSISKSRPSNQFHANRRSQSPFQANRNSFLSRRQDIPAPPETANPNPDNTIMHAGIPRTIEKKPLDEDAISGCSSSIADRIKAFEKKNTHEPVHISGVDSKPSMFSRSAPLNSYALSKLRNVTTNVGGLWS